MRIQNIDSTHFAGMELSDRYEPGGFTAELEANYYTDAQFFQTASTCGNKSLYGDYATNQVAPRYSVNLMLPQKLIDDALTIGDRVSHIWTRRRSTRLINSPSTTGTYGVGKLVVQHSLCGANARPRLASPELCCPTTPIAFRRRSSARRSAGRPLHPCVRRLEQSCSAPERAATRHF